MVRDWRDYITFENEKVPGAAFCKGTEVSVFKVISFIYAGHSDEQICFYFYPDLTATHVAACIDYWAETVNFEQNVSTTDPNRDYLLQRFRKVQKKFRS